MITNNIIEGDTIWYIQDGFKRKITSNNQDFYYNLLRKINNDSTVNNIGISIPLTNSPLLQLAKADDINKILEAQDIDHGASLSITPLIAKEIQEYLYSQLKVEFECFGVEKFYKFNMEFVKP